ncbi:MAG: glycosyltransferase family 39 protein [Chloroflexota bacterium]|nr:glycosyltransferase family 39 protein [Chloroflexota bacterium]
MKTPCIFFFIVFAYALLATLYAIYTPKWQAPDEPAHFNYIRAIGDTGALPVLQQGDYDQDYLEQIKAAKFPAAMSVDAIRYESYQPPLYYLAATPIYIAARAGGSDAQVLALRLFGVALGALVLLVAFAVVREVFPNDALLALATVGAIASVPMFIAVSASVSNDMAAVLVLALILWLAVKRVKGAVADKRFVILGGVLFGAALLTKTTAYVPGVVLLIGAEIAKMQGRKFRFSIFDFRILIPLFALAALISAPMFIRNMLTYGITDPLGLARHNAVVLGQPTTAEMIARYGLNHILFDYFAVTFKSFWAQFGWMGVLISDRIYVVLEVLSGAAAFGFALYALRVLRRRDALTAPQWWSIGLLAVTVVAAIADYIGYNFEFFQLQGRYLFPAIIPLALFGVIGLRELVAREYHRVVFALLYVALLALDLASLFLFIVPQLRITN